MARYTPTPATMKNQPASPAVFMIGREPTEKRPPVDRDIQSLNKSAAMRYRVRAAKYQMEKQRQ